MAHIDPRSSNEERQGQADERARPLQPRQIAVEDEKRGKRRGDEDRRLQRVEQHTETDGDPEHQGEARTGRIIRPHVEPHQAQHGHRRRQQSQPLRDRELRQEHGQRRHGEQPRGDKGRGAAGNWQRQQIECDDRGDDRQKLRQPVNTDVAVVGRTGECQGRRFSPVGADWAKFVHDLAVARIEPVAARDHAARRLGVDDFRAIDRGQAQQARQIGDQAQSQQQE